MKLCFSTLGCHDSTLDEILKLAQEYDVSAIEVRGIDGEMSNEMISDFVIENVQTTQKKMKKAGVVPLILGTSCKFHDPSAFKKNIAKAKNEIDVATRVGFGAIRVFGNLIVHPEEECIQQVANALDQVCEYGRTKQIQVLLEVHGDFNTVERLNSLLSMMSNTDNFGLIWDIYHTHSVYGANWLKFYEAMKPWIVHVHIKDAVEKQLILPSHGEIEIVPVIQTLLNDGYDGWFSLEWERKWVPELPELSVALHELKHLLNQHHIEIEK